jgi:hypothetical protein
MIAYQSPIARENVVLWQPKPKTTIIKITEDDESSQQGMSCLECGSNITVHDIKCSHCKTLIMRRYCSHCSKLIPDHVSVCPLCNKDVKEHFSYSRLRRTKIFIGVGTAALFIFVVLILFLQKTSPDNITAQADAVKREIPVAPPVQKLPEPEVSKQEPKLPDRTVIHEIVPPPTATKSIEIPPEVQKPKRLKSKTIVAKVEESPTVPKTEEPEPIAKVMEQNPVARVEEPKQTAKLEQPSTATARPMVSPSLQHMDDLKSQQRILKGRSLNHKGYTLIRAGRPHDAIPVLQQAVRSFPETQRDLNYAYALFNLAVAYRMAGKPEMAIPLLQERIKINDQRDVVARELNSAKREARLSNLSENNLN